MIDVVPARWILAIMGNLGFAVIYVLKVNLSVGILAMVNHTAVAQPTESDKISSVNVCNNRSSSDILMEDGPLIWDGNVQGVILGSYFYGYILTQIPGGLLAEKFSAKAVFGTGVFLNGIFTLLIPAAASISYIWVVILRAATGFIAGTSVPAMNVLISKWAPMAERNKISTTIYTGMSIGTLLGLAISGLLASSLGWENMFYIQGVISFVWYCLWVCLIYDSPEVHPRISQQERRMLRKCLSIDGASKLAGEKMVTPWISIWTSKPVLAIMFVHFCANLAWYLLLTKLPTYMRYILHFDMKMNSLLSSIPYICLVVYSLIFASIFDRLLLNRKLSTLTLRKLATFIGIMMPSLCLILMTFVGCNRTTAILLMSVGTMFMGSNFSGFVSNHIDIAPRFAGTLMGITNMIATIPGIFLPSVVGVLTQGNQTAEVWRKIFYVIATINILGVAFYFVFASSEEQKWSKPKKTSEVEGFKKNFNEPY